MNIHTVQDDQYQADAAMTKSEAAEFGRRIKKAAAEARRVGLNRDANLLEISHADDVATVDELRTLELLIEIRKRHSTESSTPFLHPSHSLA